MVATQRRTNRRKLPRQETPQRTLDMCDKFSVLLTNFTSLLDGLLLLLHPSNLAQGDRRRRHGDKRQSNNPSCILHLERTEGPPMCNSNDGCLCLHTYMWLDSLKEGSRSKIRRGTVRPVALHIFRPFQPNLLPAPVPSLSSSNSSRGSTSLHVHTQSACSLFTCSLSLRRCSASLGVSLIDHTRKERKKFWFWDFGG